MSMKPKRRLGSMKLLHLLLWAIVILPLSGIVQASTDPWVIVDTHSRTLSVYDDGMMIVEFKNIAIGRGGTAQERYEGDDKTPLGTFHIAWMNMKSRYHIFLGLDYPTMEYAARAFQRNSINSNEYISIKTAIENNELPPQDTSLGGFIGIHGLGNGSIKIHRKFDWTKGCIALTNEQIEQLAQFVRLGTKVVIR